MANTTANMSANTTASTGSTKLYKLLEGSITRYEGIENKEGIRRVVTYEANGDLAGNLVWLNEKEVKALGPKKLEEMHGNVEGAPSQDQGSANSGTAKVAAPAAATSLTGAPAGGPVGETESEEETTAASSSTNPAVARVLAKKAADGNGK